jgi:hypothetical protein
MGDLVLGKDYIKDIKTAHGEFKVTPWSVGAQTDVAVLGSLEG